MSLPSCIFCRIVKGEIPSYIVWESDTHIAFLTPTPNTPGFTVVAPKAHMDSNVLRLGSDEYQQLMLAAREAAHTIERGLGNRRTALVAEGMGVDHAHVKLIPMHGLEAGDWHPVESPEERFAERYEGFITTHEGPAMPNERLAEIQRKIRG